MSKQTSWHLIQGDTEQCAACAARDRGEKTLDTSGQPSTPLCGFHVNAAFEQHDPGRYEF